jgi:hypothetical protein
MPLIPALLLWISTAAAQSLGEAPGCPEQAPPPAHLQVAWVSPVRARVRGHSSLSVVRTGDLRTFVQAQGADQARTLQALGLVGPRGKVRKRYKITVFDVSANQLCRPVEHTPEGEDSDGLPACPGGRQRSLRFESGCGSTWDTATQGEGLDLYRVLWREAARGGFCVMPLERFLEGA